MLEDLHSGILPKSATGDFSDLKFVTPYGEIPWTQLARISDSEMHTLMLEIERKIAAALKALKDMEKTWGTGKFEENLKHAMFENGAASWNR